MLFYTKQAATIAVVILMTIALCSADIQEVKTQFMKNKVLSTSYATKEHISKLNCVQWCSKDRKIGKCKIAGYNKYAKSCSLSMDNPEDLMDTADESSGVFYIGKTLLFYEIVSFRIVLNIMYMLNAYRLFRISNNVTKIILKT